ncbi:response regulator with CheY-like receiver domain and winged-helix DNA-binding domain [Sphaerochaeta pleomorpha str. Grapes]|uniref:Response regulator with CheY-like receiver domain and winged-helix DNA-binding domain n=1 Tax=Sphaerochaeta pleomorpha (strain ATCC BAA-1885 / DSM 22778 / Grapes) TaxID=158190 RepID=G8QTD4_SPHPG|nr:response regulator transcription factor [Sphaerochaeta pleomorpha]AEV30175.1 response regulator with CheY-like receiver domain and winged-helix DNA-binding domain [Sphaerochaeta pleomorpha str. Grapes]
MKGRILIVDDERDILDVLGFVLEDAGYETRTTDRGDEVLGLVTQWRPDLVILDIGLPGLSGLEVCPCLVSMDIPVLVLSSHDRDDQIVEGLEVGAEDYVSKPFNLKELLLRIEKILRRTKLNECTEHAIAIGSLAIDFRTQTVWVEGEIVNLTPTEYKIVELLAKHAHTPVTSEVLLKQVWNSEDWIQGAEMVKVNISRVRKKLEKDPTNPRYLLNRWGYGYLLTDIAATGK